jgi:MFS transporter, OFA family, oxalate/formate antiporter
MSVVGLSMIAARLGFGYLFDRVSAHRVMLLICALMCTAFVVLGMTSEPAGVVVAAILIGIGFGSEGDALSYMTSRLFGMRDFAKIFGIIFMAFTFGGGAGPVVFAVLTRHTGSHQAALWCAAAACGLAAALATLIRRRHLLFARSDPRVAPAATPAMTRTATSA